MASGRDNTAAELQFWDMTTIHGLYEFFYLKSIVLKVIWAMVLITAFGTLTYQCLHLMSEFRAEPITTYVQNSETNDAFPTVTVCPTHFKYDWQRYKIYLKENNIDGYVTNQAQTATERADVVRTDHHLMMLSSVETMNYLKGFVHQGMINNNLNELWNEFWDKFVGNRSYVETEMYFTLNFTQVVVEQPNNRIYNQRKTMSTYGACYSFDIENSMMMPKAIVNDYKVVKFSLRRDFKSTYPAADMDGVFFTQNADVLFFGEPSFWQKSPPQYVYRSIFMLTDVLKGMEPADSSYYSFKPILGKDMLTVRLDWSFKLLLSSTTFNRLNLRRRPCRDWSEQDRSICMVQCYNDEFCRKKPDPCLLFHPNQTKDEQYKRLCSYLRDEEMFFLTGETKHCAMAPEIQVYGTFDAQCESRCPIRCKESTYFVMHAREEIVSAELKLWYNDDTSSLTTGEYWANITVAYQDPNRRVVFEEQMFWSMDSFAAVLAADVALWFGCSGLSLAQLTFNLCSLFLRRKSNLQPR